MSRYETHHTTYECDHCGAVQRGEVSVDTAAGVAGARCGECGKMTEPVPVADAADAEAEADARAEIEAEGRLDDRRERHADRHGWF